MTGLPTGTFKLDDGTGTYPTDVSSRVRMPAGVSVTYGRADETPSAQPTQLRLTLDNADGGATALVSVGQGIRMSLTIGATTRTRFTGRISAANQGWPTGDDTFSVIEIIAVDPLASLSRKMLRSMLEQEILADSPTAYYTLGEASGSTSAGDTSGSQAASLTIEGTGAAMTFGSGTGPGVDGLSAAVFAGGQNLVASAAGMPSGEFLGAGSWTIEAFVVVPSAPAAAQTIVQTSRLHPAVNITGVSYAALTVNTTGVVEVGIGLAGTGGTDRALGVTNIADGRLHHIVGTLSGTTLTIWVNGVSDGTKVVASPPSATSFLFVGGGASGVPGFSGTVSHVAIYDGAALSSARIAAHAALGLNTFTETTAARFARIAGYAGIGTVSTPTNSGQLMAGQATSGASVFDALNAVAAAEGGVMFADGAGLLTLQGHGYRAAKVSADQTLTAQDLGDDTVLAEDAQQVINQATVTRTGGAKQTAVNTASITALGGDIYPVTLELAVDSDDAALNAAQWIVGKHGTATPRIAALTLDLEGSTVAETIFQRDIGDRIALSGMPSQTWTAAGDVVVEGWTETVTHDSWVLTVNLLPWALFQYFILDNATYGVLDSTTPLG